MNSGTRKRMKEEGYIPTEVLARLLDTRYRKAVQQGMYPPVRNPNKAYCSHDYLKRVLHLAGGIVEELLSQGKTVQLGTVGQFSIQRRTLKREKGLSLLTMPPTRRGGLRFPLSGSFILQIPRFHFNSTITRRVRALRRGLTVPDRITPGLWEKRRDSSIKAHSQQWLRKHAKKNPTAARA